MSRAHAEVRMVSEPHRKVRITKIESQIRSNYPSILLVLIHNPSPNTLLLTLFRSQIIIQDTRSMHGTFVNGLQLHANETAERKSVRRRVLGEGLCINTRRMEG